MSLGLDMALQELVKATTKLINECTTYVRRQNNR